MSDKGIFSKLMGLISLSEAFQPILENLAISFGNKVGLFKWIADNFPGGGAAIEVASSALNLPRGWDQFVKRMGLAAKQAGTGEKSLGEMGGFETACAKLLTAKEDDAAVLAVESALTFVNMMQHVRLFPVITLWYNQFHELLRALTPTSLRVFGMMAAFDIDNANGRAVFEDMAKGGPDEWAANHSAALEVLRVMMNQPQLFRGEPPAPVADTSVQEALDEVEGFLAQRAQAHATTQPAGWWAKLKNRNN